MAKITALSYRIEELERQLRQAECRLKKMEREAGEVPPCARGLGETAAAATAASSVASSSSAEEKEAC